MMRRFVHILLFLLPAVLLLAEGCHRVSEGEVPEEGYGTLALQIGTGNDDTKAEGDPDPRDGEVFHNILVVVAEKNGKVVDKVYKEYPYETTGEDDPQEAMPNGSYSTDWIYFMNLKVGYYHVYAYANIEEPDWMGTGNTVADIEKNLLPGQNMNPDRQFATLTGTEVPAFPDHCMLLTGHDELYVGVDPYIGRIDLYRPVVKFEVVLDNHTPYHIQLTDLSFNAFNASDGYLIGHLDENGNPAIPNDNYRDLPAFSGPANVPANTQATVYSKLLYENRLGQDYRMFATVRFADADGHVINDDSNNPLVDGENHPLSRTLTSTGVRRVPYEDILNLPRGESMNVLMVTPNTSNGGFIGYIKTGSEQRIVYSQATYNFEESFRSKAESMLNNQDYVNLYGLTLSKESDSDKYHLYKNEVDLFSSPVVSTANVAGLCLKEGFLPSSYPISNEFLGSLCYFSLSEASNSQPLYYLDGYLKLDTNRNPDVGNRMWAFYEIHPTGSVLKLIDRETSRVSTLTQMVRGQKLTAVMNVYYKSETGEFTFSLDNEYWDNGHNPNHQFE